MNRRVIASWCLYDFANSFYVVLPAVVWQVYYSRTIVGNEQGLGDLWWGWAISLSMLLVALSSPPMGAIADYAGARKRLLVAYTLACVAAVLLFTTVQPGMIVRGFLLTVISYVMFEGALVFYNAYLPEIAPREQQGRVSGWGFGTGYAGSALGLFAALVFVRQGLYPAAWTAIALAFLFFALPAFLWLPADAPARLGPLAAARGGIAKTRRTLAEILRMPALRSFLLAYFFFEDGVNTVTYFAANFATQTLGFTDTESIRLFLVVQLSALAGAFLWARPTDTLGPKRVVMLMLGQWSLVTIAAFFVQTKMQFFMVALLAGSGLGAIQAASRAFMATLIPRGREGDFFGFFSLCGKSAAVLGPLIFGGVSRLTGGNQRAAILTVTLLFVIGGVLLARVRAGGPTSQTP